MNMQNKITTTDEDKKKVDHRLERQATFIIDRGNRLLQATKEEDTNWPVIGTATLPVPVPAAVSVPHSSKYNKQDSRMNSRFGFPSRHTQIPHLVITPHKNKPFQTNPKPSDTAKVRCKTPQERLNRMKNLIKKFNDNAKNDKNKTNEHDESNRVAATNTTAELFDGENSICVKMSGKGRVKDLVEKLNGNVNYESRKTVEHKSLPNAELRNEHHNQNDSGVSSKSEADPPHGKKRIIPTKIPDNDHDHCKKEPEKTDFDDGKENCWTKGVSTDTLYKLLSNKHSTLQRSYSQLRKQLAEEEEKRRTAENELINSKTSNLSTKDLTVEIQRLRENENRLLSEIQELREQNELLEFRLLELEYYNNTSKAERSALDDITERDDISDSGVMSLSPCEDFYSESDLLDIKLDDDEPRVTGNEVQQKLSRLFQCAENTGDKIVLQQAIDLIKHYQMRITGMETTLTNMCQERIQQQQHSEEFLTSLKSPEECSKSRTHRVIATVSPFTNPSSKQEVRLGEAASDKLFLETDRLQESGIFDEFSEMETVERKSTETQTDPTALLHDGREKTLSECSNSSSELADQLHKLEKIKQRIEEQSPLFNSSAETNTKDCNKKVPIIVLSKELTYFKKQYDLLKTKLAAYEANGDQKTNQLTDRLQKESEMQNRVEFLTKKISKMEKEMKRLEEEKCEYEEAENDTRLRCQKLEVKLYALAEKKNDLQFQLQQHIRTVSNLRNTLAELEKKKEEAYQKTYEMEMLANEYEERNFELEEREMDVRYRLQILETAFPVLLFWNLYTILRSQPMQSREICVAPLTNAAALPGPTESLVPNYCNCSTLSTQNSELRSRIATLEKDLEEKENLVCKLKEYGSELRSQIYDLEDKLKSKDNWPDLMHVSHSPMNHRRQLGLHEEVYVQTLQQADEMIASIENDFKRKLEDIQNTLTDKGWRLEECERKLAVVSSGQAMEHHLMEKTQNLEADIATLKQMLRIRDEEKQTLIEKEKCLLEEVDHLNSLLTEVKNSHSELSKKLDIEKSITKEQRKELQFKEQEMHDFEHSHNNQVKQLEKRIIKLTREVENHEVTNGELKEEVETLESAICELNLQLNHEKDDKEKMEIKFRQELATKQQEIDSLKRFSQDMTAISTAQEISLLQTEKLKSASSLTDRYSNTLPKIILAGDQNSHRNDNRISNKLKFTVEKNNNKTESCAHVIRHKDRYTILLKPLPTENYSSFEVLVNNHRPPNIQQCKHTITAENGIQNDTISLTVKPI